MTIHIGTEFLALLALAAWVAWCVKISINGWRILRETGAPAPETPQVAPPPKPAAPAAAPAPQPPAAAAPATSPRETPGTTAAQTVETSKEETPQEEGLHQGFGSFFRHRHFLYAIIGVVVVLVSAGLLALLLKSWFGPARTDSPNALVAWLRAVPSWIFWLTLLLSGIGAGIWSYRRYARSRNQRTTDAGNGISVRDTTRSGRVEVIVRPALTLRRALGNVVLIFLAAVFGMLVINILAGFGNKLHTEAERARARGADGAPRRTIFERRAKEYVRVTSANWSEPIHIAHQQTLEWNLEARGVALDVLVNGHRVHTMPPTDDPKWTPLAVRDARTLQFKSVRTPDPTWPPAEVWVSYRLY